MRWDSLFDDLESQLEREQTAEDEDLEAEHERLRLGRLSLRDRIVALKGADADARVSLTLADGSRVSVCPATMGRDWLSAELRDGSWTSCIIPISAIVAMQLGIHQVAHSLAVVAQPAVPSVSDRLGLAFVLRDLCRRRAAVELATVTGRMHGTIDRVGRDHFDLAVHEPGVPRRASAVTEYRLVPFSQVVMVRL